MNNDATPSLSQKLLDNLGLTSRKEANSLESMKPNDPDRRARLVYNLIRLFPEYFDPAEVRKFDNTGIRYLAFAISGATYGFGIYSLRQLKKRKMTVSPTAKLFVKGFPILLLAFSFFSLIPMLDYERTKEISRKYGAVLPNAKLEAYHLAKYSMLFFDYRTYRK